MSSKSRATFNVVKKSNYKVIGSITVKSNRDFKVNGKIDGDFDTSRTIKFLVKNLIKENKLSTETTGEINLDENIILKREED